MKSFKKYLGEKLKASDDMGDWVKDFQDSDAPQFKGKSKEKRRQMAIAAKLGAERDAGMREEVEQIDELKKSTLGSYIKKASARAVSDKTTADRLSRRAFDADNHDNAEKYFDASDRMQKKYKNRLAGIAKASDRLTKEEVELDEGILKSYHSIANKPWSQSVKDSKNTAGEYSQIAKGKDFTVWTGYSGSLKKQAHYVVRDDKIIGSGWTMNSALKDAGLKDKDLTARSKFAAGSILNKGMKESVDLDEAAPKMKGDWLKKERERNRAHDAAMGRTPTGRKKPVRQMTSTQKSLAKMRGEEVELDEVLDTPKAMDSYRNKAKYSKERAANSAAAKMLRNPKGFHSTDTSDELNTMDKRAKGLKMADRAAARKTRAMLMKKEEAELDEMDNNTIAAAIRLKMQQDAEKKYRDSKLKKKASNSKTPQNRMFGKFDNETKAAATRLKMQQDAEKKYRNSKLKKEEAELDEAKTDIYHKHMLKALGKTRLPKNHSYTSAIANNGDFVVKDGGGRTVGRIPKGEHNLKD